MIVCLFMKAPGEKILAVVVFAFLLVAQISIAGIETLGQKQQSADTVAVIGKVSWVFELVRMAFRMVSPDVLDLVTVFTAPLDVFNITGGLARTRLDVVRHTGKQAVDLPAVHTVQLKAVVTCEGDLLGGQTLGQNGR